MLLKRRRLCVKLLADKEMGACLFRPSTQGVGHIALSWKFFDEVNPVRLFLSSHFRVRTNLLRVLFRSIKTFVHFSVLETEKGVNPLMLGKKLTIENEDYSDLNEIVARFIEPMNALARDFIRQEKFRTASQAEVCAQLLAEKVSIRTLSFFVSFFV